MKSSTIYIVTPSYNAVNAIDRTILSIISQEGDFSIHLHVQDGGSTDGTVPKLKSWKKLVTENKIPSCNTKRITFTFDSSADSGMYDAILRGFKRLSITNDASFMTWLNAGDQLLPNAISVVAGLSNDALVNWIGSYQYVYDSNTKCFLHERFPFPQEVIAAGLCDIDNWPTVQQEGCFWRYGLWKSVGGINPEFKLAGDWDLWRRFAEKNPIYMANSPLALFRIEGEQLSRADGGRAYRTEIDKTIASEERKKRLVQMTAILSKMKHHVLVSSPKGYVPTEMLIDPNILPPRVQSNLAAHSVPMSCGEGTSYLSGTIISHLVDELEKNARQVKDLNRQINTKQQSFELLKKSVNPANIKLSKIVSYSVPQLHKNEKEIISVLRKSGLFFYAYFLTTQTQQLQIDPLIHFIRTSTGNPNPLFDSKWYLTNYPEVKRAGHNPLYHYVKWGAQLGYNPHPDFSTTEYLTANPEVAISGINPLGHYLFFGALEGRPVK